MKLLAYLQSCVWVHLSGLRHIQTSTSRTGSRWQRAPHPWAMAHVHLKDLILKNKHCRTYRVCQHFFSEGGNGRKKNVHNCVGTGLRYLVLPSLRPSEIWHSAGIGRILQPWLFELWIPKCMIYIDTWSAQVEPNMRPLNSTRSARDTKDDKCVFVSLGFWYQVADVLRG